jgi:multidrug efflux pump subunit AcrB
MAKPSFRDRFNLSWWSIRHSWLSVSVWLAVAVAGVLAFGSLKYALLPEISFPVTVVRAQAALETALATESQLTSPLETQLAAIEGLKEMRSSTYPGRTTISLAFRGGTNLTSASDRVEERLSGVSNLPPNTSYEVVPFDLNESAVASYAINSNSYKLQELAEIARERVIPPLESLPGVRRVDLLGTLTAAAASDKQPTLVRFNRENALAFRAIKSAEANTLEIIAQVEREVKRLQEELPQVQLSPAATEAKFIRESIQATIDALAVAILLSVLVIWGFLRNWRATLLSALAIPTSLLATFVVMAIFGFELEVITLLALALVIGILVDDAIVEVENISRHMENSESAKQATFTATQEIGVTVSAATLTIVAVFLPIGFMGGVLGQFFKPFGITVSAAVLASLLVARTLLPPLAAKWLPLQSPNPQTSRTWERFRDRYASWLKWSLRHRRTILILAIASFLAGLALIPLIPKGFIPQLDRGAFYVTYETSLPGATRHSPQTAFTASQEVAAELEATIFPLAEVESIFTVIGDRGRPNTGRMYVKLAENRQKTTAQIQDELRAALPKQEGVTTSVTDIPFVDLGEEKPIQLALVGENMTNLSEAAKNIQAKLEAEPGFVDISVRTSQTQNNRRNQFLQIERLNGQRAAYIQANFNQQQNLGDATDRAVAIAQSILPANIDLDLGGDSQRGVEILSSFAATLVLSLVFMFVVLLVLFHRWQDPMVVMLSLPLATVGAMLGLLVARSDFGMISLIGIIFLLGLIDKNAILIVDYTNQLRRWGLSRHEALLQAAPARLRPILMTTVSTILGMLPIALGWGAGSQLRSPMAIAIIGGLITSSLLSLLVVPVLYTLLEDMRGYFMPNRQKNQS